MQLSHKVCKNGFTLIEMLVVIAIIGILAALLMPSLQSAIESTRQVVCVNNLRQISVGVNMYSGEYNGYFPPVGTWGGGILINTWYGTIDPDGTEIVFCPKDPNQSPVLNRLEMGTISYGFNNQRLGGGMSWFNGMRGSTKDYSVPAKQSHIRQPSKTVAYIENAAKLSSGLDYGYYHTWCYRDTNNPVAYNRHGEKCNILWVDSHSEPMATPAPEILYEAGFLGNPWTSLASDLWDRD